MGVVKCLQRAKDAVYWPGMSKDITDMILKCETCINVRNSNAKEPMTPGPTPNRSVLEQREKVRMQVQGRWIPATVVSRADTPHSYIVETQSGKKYRRNRHHLMKCYQDNESSFDDYVPPVENPAQEE